MAVNLGPSDGFDTIKTAPTHKESLETMREVEQLAMQSIAASDLPGPETVEGWAGLPTYPPETPIKKGIVSAILRTIHNIPPCVWVTNLHVDDITVVVSRYRPSRLLTGVEVNVSPSGGGLGFSTTAYPGPATKKTLAPQDQDPAASTAVFPVWTKKDAYVVISIFIGTDKTLYIENDRVPVGSTVYFVNKPDLVVIPYQ